METVITNTEVILAVLVSFVAGALLATFYLEKLVERLMDNLQQKSWDNFMIFMRRSNFLTETGKPVTSVEECCSSSEPFIIELYHNITQFRKPVRVGLIFFLISGAVHMLMNKYTPASLITGHIVRLAVIMVFFSLVCRSYKQR